MKKIIVDSNILGRLIEFELGEIEDKIIIKINEIKPYIESSRLYVNDSSFFEVIDNISRDSDCNNKYLTLIKLFNKYGIRILCRETTKKLYKEQYLFLAGKLNIKMVKRISFNSFIYSLCTFIIQISQYISLSLLKALAKGDYNSEWYVERSLDVTSKEYRRKFMKILKEAIKESYFLNKTKTKYIIDEILKETIVMEIAHYKLHESKDEKTKENFRIYFGGLMKLCENCDYYELLHKLIQNDYANIEKGPDMDCLSYDYLKYICFNLITHKRKIKLNDLVDFINFKTAYENNYMYLTFDRNSLNLYEEIFSDKEEIMKFINDCKTMTK